MDNKPVFFGSWLTVAAIMILMAILVPRIGVQSPGFIAYLVGFFICFVLFGWQGLKANLAMQADAAHGAAERRRLENAQDETSNAPDSSQRVHPANSFDHINKPIIVGSWLGAMISTFVLMPRLETGTPLYYLCWGITAICAVLFGWQCMKGAFGTQSDAKRGAALREREENREKGD